MCSVLWVSDQGDFTVLLGEPQVFCSPNLNSPNLLQIKLSMYMPQWCIGKTGVELHPLLT